MVVAGGGPAGATAARCLARAGHRVLLADSSDPAAFKIGEALPPVARTLLTDLGLWEGFAGECHLPCYGNAAAWGSPDLWETDFVFDPHGHGWHLDRVCFDEFLRAAAGAAGADVRTCTAVRNPVRTPDRRWRLELRTGQQCSHLECDWLVDATGRAGAIARTQGARRQTVDSLVGVYARFHPAGACSGVDGDHARDRDRDSRTLIEAVPEGWWYSALVPSGHRVVAFLTDADLLGPPVRTLSGFVALSDRTVHIRQCLAQHGYVLGMSPRGAPARSAWLRRPIGDGWLAVGDAAMSCDPVSSQGILTALYTGMIAGQALHDQLSGAAGAVARYERDASRLVARYQHNRAAVYQREQRWPQEPFWRRRRSASP